jgi:hypothetical protein
MKNITTVFTRLAATLVFVGLISGIANANPLFTLENLERERAALINTLTTKALSSDLRQLKSQNIIRRLIDMERMVLRDDRIAGSHSVIAKKAFANYELTFLVHAGSEAQKLPIDHWLSTLDISSASIKQSKIGNR